MARVTALVPDLLFGSNVQGALGAAGHEVQLVGSSGAVDANADVLVVDLMADGVDPAAHAPRGRRARGQARCRLTSTCQFATDVVANRRLDARASPLSPR